jgi:hypothetical protein
MLCKAVLFRLVVMASLLGASPAMAFDTGKLG